MAKKRKPLKVNFRELNIIYANWEMKRQDKLTTLTFEDYKQSQYRDRPCLRCEQEFITYFPNIRLCNICKDNIKHQQIGYYGKDTELHRQKGRMRS